jgi:hypothetical protein
MSEKAKESASPELVAVLDMGASAIHLVIAEIAPNRAIRIVERSSRGVLLGRDTFSTGTIRSRTVEAAVVALEGSAHHRWLRRVADACRCDQRVPKPGTSTPSWIASNSEPASTSSC